MRTGIKLKDEIIKYFYDEILQKWHDLFYKGKTKMLVRGVVKHGLYAEVRTYTLRFTCITRTHVYFLHVHYHCKILT